MRFQLFLLFFSINHFIYANEITILDLDTKIDENKKIELKNGFRTVKDFESGYLAKNTKLCGIFFKKGTRIFIVHCNRDRVLTLGTLLHRTNIHHMCFRENTELTFHGNGIQVHTGYLHRNTKIRGYIFKKCKKSRFGYINQIVFHENGLVYKGILAQQYNNFHSFAKDKKIIFYDNGKIFGGWLVNDFISYDNIEKIKRHIGPSRKYKPAYLYEYDISFFKDGSIRSAFIEKSFTKNNIDVPKNSYVSFYKTGNIRGITIFKNEKIINTLFKPEREEGFYLDVVTFYENGNIEYATFGESVIIDGKKYLPNIRYKFTKSGKIEEAWRMKYTYKGLVFYRYLVFYKNGKLKRGILLKSKVIDGKMYKKGTEINFDTKGNILQ